MAIDLNSLNIKIYDHTAEYVQVLKLKLLAVILDAISNFSGIKGRFF